jgi:amphi-Trp domain-containing protein
MGDEKNAIEYAIQTTLDDCIDKLEGIVAGLENRQVFLRNRSDALDLHPTPVVYMSVKAKQSGTKESLIIEVGWKVDQHLASGRSDGLQVGRARNDNN